jgi:glycosyltransferase involved in cell wall biosynthesis
VRGNNFYEQLTDIPQNFIATTPPPTLPINFLSEGMAYDMAYKFNRKVVLNSIHKVIKDFQLKDFIYLTCFDPFFVPVLPKEYGAALSIYQCIDDISTEPYVAKHGVRLEVEAAIESDITLVTSTNLWRKFKQIQPETHIMHVKNKIIGFVGNLDPVRIDYALLKHIAEAHPDKTLLLVGPINSPDVTELGLDKMPNVILTGAKRIQEVPHYLKFMDVAILPSILNKMSKSVYPLKINEYLAAGKAAVATNFSEDIRGFQPHVRIADSYIHFDKLINEAVVDYSEEKVRQRMAIAERNTWGDRVREFWEIVNGHLEQRKEGVFA